MNEYLKKYIELLKKFNEPKGKSESVRTLDGFKEELEQMEDLQAKEVLVNVYNLLDYKKSAYDLLCKIGDKSDPKVFKRLATMKDMRKNGAIIMPSKNQRRKRRKERIRKNSYKWVCRFSDIIQIL